MREGQQVLIDGRSARWDAHRAVRRAELVQVARRVVHQGGPDVSMDEIAAAAGTSKSIVYRYFADKAALQVAVAEAVVEQMGEALRDAAGHAAGLRQRLSAMVGVYLEMIERSPNVYGFVTRRDDGPASAFGHFAEAVAGLVAGHVDRPEVRTWAAGAVGFVRGVGETWLARPAGPDRPSRSELTEQIVTWLWSGAADLTDPTTEEPR